MVQDFMIPGHLASSDRPTVIAAECDDRTRHTEPHVHTRGQLIASSKGLVSIGSDEAQWVVPAVHAMWIPPNMSHSMHSHEGFTGWSVYVAENACRLLPQSPVAIRVTPLLRELVIRAVAWPEGDMTGPQSRLASVLLDEIASSEPAGLDLPMPKDPRVLGVAEALLKEPGSPLMLADFAERAAIPLRTLSRKFVTETGFSFTEWRQRARLMAGMKMLSDGAPVTTVALDLGYSSIGAFTVLFKQTFGITPREFQSHRGAGRPSLPGRRA